MDQKKLARFKKALEELRTKLLAEGPQKIEPNRKDAEAVGVPDEDAQALSEMLQTLASQRNRRQSDVLKLIARALEKIARSPDDYGLCEECDEEIPDKRLVAMPYVALCTECQASADPKRGQSRKSLTDYK
jgi:DnaK suppressor protein